MFDLSKYLDAYERKARVYPALLMLLPLVVSVSSKFPTIYTSFTGLVVLFATFGGLHLIAQVGRDAGKKLEPTLHAKWGGIPSVTIFRHTDSVIPKPAKLRLHQSLSEVTDTANPSPDDELINPASTDEIYRTWSDFLRNNARDTNKFDLLFKENINYGFRRNVLGLKKGYMITGILSLFIMMYSDRAVTQVDLGISAVIATYTLFFVVWVNESWVKIPGIEYAKRLVETHKQM